MSLIAKVFAALNTDMTTFFRQDLWLAILLKKLLVPTKINSFMVNWKEAFFTAVFIVVLFNLLLAVISCTTQPHRVYNQDTVQNKDCYQSYGGKYGYCDKNLWEIK